MSYEESVIKRERLEKTLEKLDEKVVESTIKAATKIYEKHPNMQPSTVLAIAFYINNEPITQKDSAIKFDRCVSSIQKYIPEIPKELGMKESDYKCKGGIDKEKTTTWITLKLADELDWEEDVHYSKTEDYYGNTQASVKRKGMLEIWEEIRNDN